jgi:hypothetical protein
LFSPLPLLEHRTIAQDRRSLFFPFFFLVRGFLLAVVAAMSFRFETSI